MPPEFLFLLHVGHEVTFAEYLSRVLVYLVASGGIGLLVYWVSGLFDPSTRSGAAPENETAER